MLANSEIRKTAKEKGVMLWEVADALKVSEATITRKLRKELPTAEKQRIFNVIEEIAAEKKNAANGATNTN